MEAGSSVIGRVSVGLRLLSQHEPGGVTTSELARGTGLPRPTAHRFLAALQTEGFVDRDSGSGRWVLGPEMFLLGAATSVRYDATEEARPHLRRLAEATGESAFFSVRRGDETVCLLREDGSFPIRSFVLYEGVRFPLGVASAGLVILSYLGEREMTDYLDRASLTDAWGASHSRAEVERRVRETRVNGYSTNPGLLVEGSWGIGAAVFNAKGDPQWALTLTGVEHRFAADRRPRLGSLLLSEAHRLSERLQTPRPGHGQRTPDLTA
jgi:DNA-binding IclR family transcriptional regulator